MQNNNLYCKANLDEEDKNQLFVKELEYSMKELEKGFSHLIFLCVGTDLIMGDSVGPIIGTKLKKIENEYIKVFGTLSNTLNFNNARDEINKIYLNYSNPYIITIDAALSNFNEVGDIVIDKGFIKIGKALEKSICFYSNTNIKCVVGNNMSVKENLNQLKNIEEQEIHAMANIVSSGIQKILNKINIYV